MASIIIQVLAPGIVLAAASLAAPQGRTGWEPLGLSGGGSMYAPAISPLDPNLMMLNCDMSDAFLTADGGRTWRMIHRAQLRSNTQCRPAFSPADRNVLFAANGWTGGLAESQDGGLTWEAVGDLKADLAGEIAIDPDRPARMLAGTWDGAWLSEDGGRSWVRCAGPRGRALGFHFDRTSPEGPRVCFAGTVKGVWRSDDGGKTWREKSKGLPWRGLLAFAAGSSTVSGACVLYCSIPAKTEDGKAAGGVYRSLDRGERWRRAMGPGINQDTRRQDEWADGPVAQYRFVLASDAAPRSVWALNTNTGFWPPHHTAAFRSDDAGDSWRATLYEDPRFKACNAEPNYMTAELGQAYQSPAEGAALDPADPDHLVYTNDMRVGMTRDGGKTWTNGHTRPSTGSGQGVSGDAPAAKDSGWLCNGLVVTTAWHHYVDPVEPDRRYICYTDLGFARSLDAGKTWKWWGGKNKDFPWRNTCYELAFDPSAPGKMWGAFSDVHDIPNANIILGRHESRGPGGVGVSIDFGETWKPAGRGLPSAPVTSVAVDPESPVGGRTLYAGVFGRGVYRSDDDGATWALKAAGLGAESNRRVTRVHRHPDGTLFALVTALRRGEKFRPEGVGLYRSTDKGEHWEFASASLPLLWPKDFAVDPGDGKDILLGAADANGLEQGGLYRTRDGGATWSRLARKGPEHFGAAFNPRHAGWLYMTLCEDAPGSGLWLSQDDGATWAPLDGLPFANVMRVEFGPEPDGRIFVSTFGGSVWRGPEAE